MMKRQQEQQPLGKKKKKKDALLSGAAFWILAGLVLLALLVSVGLYWCLLNRTIVIEENDYDDEKDSSNLPAPHLHPRLPHLPAFPALDNTDQLIHQTLEEGQPTIAGIGAVLYRFLEDLHQSHQQLIASEASPDHIRSNYVRLAQQHLVPLDKAYQGRPVFPIRPDDSIFVSVASFREHLLADTLVSLFANAQAPDKLFVGVIVNNCFDAEQCQGAVQVVGKNKNGRDKLKPLEAGIADQNHVEAFCNNRTMTHYCESGHLRVLYVNESEALGPAVARYYSSKLWGGETYYVQVDSHLKFAQHWDALYIRDLKRASSYPKAVLSTYPPGFVNFRPHPPFTPCTRLCRCQLRAAEGFLPRIEMEGRCHENQTRPTQMPFLGAGFFFAPAAFLVDVPFDPFLPYMFMGEEIALSIRAWTHGWNIYAPTVNLIGHQYRPLSMGTPHFQESLARIFNRPGMVPRAQGQVGNRIKHMMGYGGARIEKEVLVEAERYGLGTERSRQDYLQFAEIDLGKMTCGAIQWCVDGTLE